MAKPAATVNGLQPYPEYKPSVMEWLGDVPTHWDVRRYKQISAIAYGDSLPNESRRNGLIPVFGSNGPVGFHDAANTNAPCVVIGRKGSFGKVNYSNRPVFAIDTTFFIDDRSSLANLRWTYYLLGQLGLDQVTKDSAIPGLDRKDVYASCVPVPPLPEQSAIARYLDHADWRIRRCIQANQKLTALLEEQKQAIIHSTLTRGLEPTACFKASESRWFPRVPAHWRVLPMRRVIYSAVDGPHFSPTYLDTGIPFLSARNVKPDGWSLDNAKYISEEDYHAFNRRVKPEHGDVLYTKGGTTGVARAVDLAFPFQVWVHIAVLKVNKNMIDPEFLAMALNSPRCYEQSQLHTRGATNQDLGLGRMKRIEIPVPPTLSEQRSIVRYVATAIRQIIRGISSFEREIALLREFQTRLVADVVTGKLDVREAARRLPDEGEEWQAIAESDASTNIGSETGEVFHTAN